MLVEVIQIEFLCTLILFTLLLLQKSFFNLLQDEKRSEAFFKVLYDKLLEAQTTIKASMSATTDASLAQSMDTPDKEKIDQKRERLITY